jgi:hypothetical protein
MRFFTGFILILAISLSAAAQQPAAVATPFGPQAAAPVAQITPPPAGPPAFFPDSPTRVFALRYVDGRSIEKLLQPIGVPISREPSLNAIAVKAPLSTLTVIEEMIKKFDVPANASKKVEITAYLVLASPQPEPDAVPNVLKPVIDQLRSVMTYKSYRVVDTILVTGKEGDNTYVDGVLPKLNDTDSVVPVYSFSALPRVSGEGAEQLVHLENLSLNISVPMPGQGGSRGLRIGTAIDVKKGQHAVVGKATVGERAVVLVLSAKILD